MTIGFSDYVERADMVTLRVGDEIPNEAIDFLKHCYRFVNQAWPHAQRDDLPDRGFERTFRASCTAELTGWGVSQDREMHLGSGLSTASGVLHEIDLVASHPTANAIIELKNRQGSPTKNDVIVLFAKSLDYLACNPDLLLKEFFPVFVSTAQFEPHALAACLGLGVHPVGPQLRPVPLLIDTAKRITFELRRGLHISDEANEAFQDFCAELNGLSLNLADSWIGSRFGHRSESTIIIRAYQGPDADDICQSLLSLNLASTKLLSDVRRAKL